MIQRIFDILHDRIYGTSRHKATCIISRVMCRHFGTCVDYRFANYALMKYWNDDFRQGFNYSFDEVCDMICAQEYLVGEDDNKAYLL